MAINIEPLRRILELEIKKGYPDSAVIGGLDRFLARWSKQNRELIGDPQQLKHFLSLTSTSYAALTREERRAWVARVLSLATELAREPAAPGGVSLPPEPPRAPRRRRAAADTTSPAPGPSVAAPITTIKGISDSLAAKFHKLGVNTVRDLLYFFPRRHLDYSQVKTISQLAEGDEQTIIANVWQARITMPGGRRSTEAIVGDETGNIRAVWFNQPYLARQFQTNARVVLSGRVSLFQGQHVFQSPEWERLEDQDLVHTGRLVPIYPLTRGLYSRQVRRLMKAVVDGWAGQLPEFLPPELRQRCRLPGLAEAISQAHYPENETAKAGARRRLAFDELLLLQLGVLSKKRHWQQGQPGNPLPGRVPALDTFIKSLPFTLTGAQQRVMGELLADMARARPMSRLLQGEVGSGKTVVAAAALLVAAAHGYQGALMAPTEILAEQHFDSLCQLLAQVGQEEGEGYQRRFTGFLERPLTIALLIGDIRQLKKQALQQGVQGGGVDIAIGTHALIQKGVAFKRLGLAVVDEQHRFGVGQRSALRQKGFNPHVLVMTATPIPRTLALTLYGDLDLSVIDELPPGRQEIKTKWLKPEQRASAYNFIRRQVAAGRLPFLICPFMALWYRGGPRAATAEYEQLSRQVFPDLRLGLLHGRLSAAEKEKVMRDFRSGELDILVSTPVVEVGIDVPNATVMMVETAERFGLSQLHQFRGRVGRGTEASHCMLLAENPSEIGRQRLDIIERVQDGFQLAEEDLKLRGPGEFFGTRQSGLPDLRMAKLSDVALLEIARHEAIMLFEKDK
ncbi:MAG: ATP-dependent DNA helicase RecG, partial [Chloroflexota bacterium]